MLANTGLLSKLRNHRANIKAKQRGSDKNINKLKETTAFLTVSLFGMDILAPE